MFERFTERARQIVVLSQEEARRMGHTYIGREHVLLGTLAEKDGLGAKVFESLGLTRDTARAEVEKIAPPTGVPTFGTIPFTPRAKRVMELCLREALSLGHNYIGTEHVALALAREGEGPVPAILATFNVDSERLRNEVIRALGDLRPPNQPSSPNRALAKAKMAREALLDMEKLSEDFRSDSDSARLKSALDSIDAVVDHWNAERARWQ